jgi:general secretion pathway protein M
MPFNLNLQRREKMAVTAAAIVLGVFLLLQIIVFPVIDRGGELRQQIKSKTQALQEMHTLKAEYVSLSRYSNDMENGIKKRSRTFTLFSFIDKLAGTSGIKSNIVYMKPSTSNLKNSSHILSTVEIKLNALTMQQLTSFLYGIEDSANMVWIRRLSISKGDNNQSLLNSVLQVETFEL